MSLCELATSSPVRDKQTARCHQSAMVELQDVSKAFVLHQQGKRQLSVLENFSLSVAAGECVILRGVSGAGKSTVLRLVYGNYLLDSGEIRLHMGHHPGPFRLAAAHPRQIAAFRRRYIAYVSQFLRVVPRLPTLQVVMEPALRCGIELAEAQDRAEQLLDRLGIGRTLWGLPPATFSGGEKQRVNIARGFVAQHPLLLLDEPTASLDSRNKGVVIGLMREAKRQGAALLGVFHDEEVICQIADHVVEMEPMQNDE